MNSEPKLMKTTHCLFALALLSLPACSTTSGIHPDSAKADPETVMITYHVKPDEEAKLQALLSRVWQIYRTENLVFATPHIIVRNAEEGDKTRFVEIFTWTSHSNPEHAPDSVTAIWNQEQSLCETRSGRTGIEGGEVEILAGK